MTKTVNYLDNEFYLSMAYKQVTVTFHYEQKQTFLCHCQCCSAISSLKFTFLTVLEVRHDFCNTITSHLFWRVSIEFSVGHVLVLNKLNITKALLPMYWQISWMLSRILGPFYQLKRNGRSRWKQWALKNLILLLQRDLVGLALTKKLMVYASKMSPEVSFYHVKRISFDKWCNLHTCIKCRTLCCVKIKISSKVLWLDYLNNQYSTALKRNSQEDALKVALYDFQISFDTCTCSLSEAYSKMFCGKLVHTMICMRTVATRYVFQKWQENRYS